MHTHSQQQQPVLPSVSHASSLARQDSFFKADDDSFVFGSDNDDDDFGKMDQPHSTYHYPDHPSQTKQSPLLSDAPLPPLQTNYSYYSYYENASAADQYRSTQLQSPQFDCSESDASTTVSPRDIFADHEPAQRNYPTLFPNARVDSSSSNVTHSPHTPVDEQPIAQPSRLTSIRQESTASYSSYASTSSDDEEVPPTPLMIPEPKAHSHSYPTHVRAASNGTTLSPHMAFLATSPQGTGFDGASSSRKPIPKYGFQPLEQESKDVVEQQYAEGREDGGEGESFDVAVASQEVAAAAPSFDKKRASPFDEDDDDGDSRYHSSASDDDDDRDGEYKYVSRAGQREKARRNSQASQANGQLPKTKKKQKVDPRTIRRSSAGAAAASSSATPAPAPREPSTPPEATCWCVVPGCTDAKGAPLGFVRSYDLKRHEDSAHASAPSKYWCDTCRRDFSRKDALIRHLKTIDHSIPLSKRRGPGGGGGSKKR